MADRLFDDYLKKEGYDKIVLMSGGPASGKTEFVSEYLVDENYLIFDGVLPSENGARIKIQHIQKTKKDFEVIAVWPSDFQSAYSAFLSRDRKFSDEYFFSKHASSRKTLHWIAASYPDIIIKLYFNSYSGNDLSFYEVRFDKKRELVAFLLKNQYSNNDIINLIFR